MTDAGEAEDQTAAPTPANPDAQSVPAAAPGAAAAGWGVGDARRAETYLRLLAETELRAALAFEVAAALRPRPAVTVVLTDGYTPWPDGPPRAMRVVVGLLGDEPPDPPEWARTVRIPAD